MSYQTFGTPFGMGKSGSSPTPDPIVDELAKSAATTGVLYGMMPTKYSGDATKLDISAGAVRIVDRSDPKNTKIEEHTFEGITDHKPSLENGNGTYVLIWDHINNVIEDHSITDVDEKYLTEHAILGSFESRNSIILNVQSSPINVGNNAIGGLIDGFIGLIGPGNISGNTFTANGNNMKIDKDEGVIWSMWANYHNDMDVPCNRFIAGEDEIEFTLMWRGSDGQVKIGADTTDIVPDIYNPRLGETKSVETNHFTVQVIYIMDSGGIAIALGQQSFETMAEAKDALVSGSLRYDEYPPLTNYVRRCYLIVREGISTLTNITDSQFIDAGRFRGNKSYSV